jgi:hypothetical protein
MTDDRHCQVTSRAESDREDRHGRAEMRLWCVVELRDKRMSFQRLLHDPTLHANAPPVDEPNLAEAGTVCSRDVFLDHRRDVARGEGVKIEGWLDRNVVRHVKVREIAGAAQPPRSPASTALAPIGEVQRTCRISTRRSSLALPGRLQY